MEETDEMVSGRCKACGDTLAGVNEQEYERMLASHILDNHESEAPRDLIEECEGVLAGDADE